MNQARIEREEAIDLFHTVAMNSKTLQTLQDKIFELEARIYYLEGKIK